MMHLSAIISPRAGVVDAAEACKDLLEIHEKIIAESTGRIMRMDTDSIYLSPPENKDDMEFDETIIKMATDAGQKHKCIKITVKKGT